MIKKIFVAMLICVTAFVDYCYSAEEMFLRLPLGQKQTILRISNAENPLDIFYEEYKDKPIDEWDYNRLQSLLKPFVVKLIYKYRMNEEIETDDIVNEIAFAIYSRISYFRNKSKFSTWVYSIARNKICDRISKIVEKNGVGRKKALYSILRDNELWSKFLKSNLFLLKGKERKIIELYLQGKTMKEIADITGEKYPEMYPIYHQIIFRIAKIKIVQSEKERCLLILENPIIKMSQRQRSIMELWLRGEKYLSIAEKLDMRYESVRSAVRRGVKKLDYVVDEKRVFGGLFEKMGKILKEEEKEVFRLWLDGKTGKAIKGLLGEGKYDKITTIGAKLIMAVVATSGDFPDILFMDSIKKQRQSI